MCNKGMDSFEVLLMQENEIETTFEIINKEGWNITLPMFAKIKELFPNSIFVAVNSKKEIVATVTFVPLRKDEFVLGNLIVAENARRRGLGKHIVRRAMASLPDNSSVSLLANHGTDKFYNNLGFVRTDHCQEAHIMDVDMSRLVGFLPHEDVTLVPYTPDLLKDVQAFDSRTRSYDDERFVRIRMESSEVSLVGKEVYNLEPRMFHLLADKQKQSCYQEFEPIYNGF